MSRMFEVKAGRMSAPRQSRTRFRVCVVLQLGAVFLVIASLKLGSNIHFGSIAQANDKTSESDLVLPGQNDDVSSKFVPPFVVETDLSLEVQRLNRLPSRNLDLYPHLENDHVKVVLYVHNRPQYLKVVVESLSQVHGINETLLIVSHDGTYAEMNDIVQSIRFCQVKQIFAPYSPHLYPDSFPGISSGDCGSKGETGCTGNPDQYGNYRSKIVSLKHHWWWMMNTVWDGLAENSGFDGHLLFIEEDHYIFPNAYRNIQTLTQLKNKRCPYCYAANLAPLDFKSRGEGGPTLYTEKVGNVGYAFNRTIWKLMHLYSQQFCSFDDYNWDITMWATVYPNWGQGSGVYTLRAPRASAKHFGKCGMHQGRKDGQPACDDRGFGTPTVFPADMVPNIDPGWAIHKYSIKGYTKGHVGWGGWGDKRDHQLCLYFSGMYRQ